MKETPNEDITTIKILLALTLLAIPFDGFSQEDPVTENGVPEVVVSPDEMVDVDVPAEKAEEAGKLKVLLSKIQQGKTTGYVLLAISIVAVTIALERLSGLRGNKIVPPGFSRKADEYYRAGKFEEIRKLCADQPSVLASIVDELVVMRGGI